MQIVLADDHKLMRDGLRPFLGKLQVGARVLEAADFPEAVAVTKSAGAVDLALLDLMMPGMNGVSGLSSFVGQFPETRVVLLSAFGDASTVLDAINAGASGFIPKTIGGNGLVNALRLVLSGEVYVPSTTLLEMAERRVGAGGMLTTAMRTPSRPAAGEGQPPLSQREREVVALLTEGLPNKVIASRLNLGEPTVKACLRGLYRKIGAANRAQAVKILLAMGGMVAR